MRSGRDHPPQRTAAEIGTEQRYQDLVRSLAALDEAVESSDVMQVFLDLARRQGARLLLLRQWSTGLRILLAEGVELPARLVEPRSANPRVMTKREHDLFDVLTRERVAYAGPVPVENVPRELLEALSVGEDQVALIVPLPLRGKWCTYIYLDWLSFQGEQLVQDAALLARHALLRLHALERDALPLGSGMREILGAVTSRRRDRERNHFDGLRPGDLPARQVYEQVGEMTVMPQVAGRLLEMINDQRATPAMLEKEIARDLVLAAQAAAGRQLLVLRLGDRDPQHPRRGRAPRLQDRAQLGGGQRVAFGVPRRGHQPAAAPHLARVPALGAGQPDRRRASRRRRPRSGLRGRPHAEHRTAHHGARHAGSLREAGRGRPQGRAPRSGGSSNGRWAGITASWVPC